MPSNPYRTPLNIPAPREPQEVAVFKRNADVHAKRAAAIRHHLRSRKTAVNVRMLTLAKRYCLLREQQRTAAKDEGGVAVKKLSRDGKQQALSRSARATAVNSDYEEMQVISALQAVEKLKTLCRLPAMILDEREREARVLPSDCALVEDPVGELKQQALVNIWTPEERRIFVDKFQQYPKDFRRISSFLEHRSVGDCVRYFYENQKSEEFANYRRKKQLKKRRLYSEVSKRKGFMVAAAGNQKTDAQVCS
jgi:hypothetical protein